MSTPDQVNSFFVGSVIDRRIFGIMTVALAPVVPVLTSMSVSGDFTRLGNTYLRGGRYALWTSLAIACPLFVFADDFVGLYLDETYADTATVMMILLATFPFTYPDVMLSRIAIATAKLQQFFAGALVSTIITVIVAVVALKNSDTGAVTLALVFSGANVIMHLVFYWPLGLRLAKVSVGAFVRQTLVPGLLPAVVGSLVWWGLSLAFGAATWLALFVNSLVGGFVYIAVLLRFCLQSDEQQSVRRLRQRAGLMFRNVPSTPEPRS